MPENKQLFHKEIESDQPRLQISAVLNDAEVRKSKWIFPLERSVLLKCIKLLRIHAYKVKSYLYQSEMS